MIEILAHRGCWLQASEQNTLTAFEMAFRSGFGIELDVRDELGSLIVSHDISGGTSCHLSDVIALYLDLCSCSTIAVNIKSDGLASMIKDLFKSYGVRQYFVFDMSIPDTMAYLSDPDIPTYIRRSELEDYPKLTKQADGIWVDELTTTWLRRNSILHMISDGVPVALVSPELHHRTHVGLWEILKDVCSDTTADVLKLCTDFPFEAHDYFNA